MVSYDKRSKELRVLVLSHTSDITGGAELSMLDVFDNLSERYNVKPTFVLRKPLKSMVGALDKRGWGYQAIDYGFWSEVEPTDDPKRRLRQEVVNNKAIGEIEEIIKDLRPDLVLTNSIVCPWAAVAAYLQAVPHVWFVREYGDLDHGRTFTIGREATFQAIDSMSDMVVANSVTLAKHIHQYIDTKKVSTLYTPFNISELVEKSKSKIRSPYRHADSLKLVIASGSVTASKGHLEIVQAVAELSRRGHSVEVCLIGRTDNKPYYQQIVDVIDSAKLSDRVHFAGFHSNPLPFMSAADIGIMTSRMEAFGRVTFEYLALGMPVIGANSGATPEMVHDGVNGYLFDLSKHDTLVNSIEHYLANRKLVAVHGENSKKKALDMMSREQNIDAFYKNIITLLANSAMQPRHVPPKGLIHLWLTYPELSDKLSTTSTQTIKSQVKQRVKNKIRPAYHAVRGEIAKRTGK